MINIISYHWALETYWKFANRHENYRYHFANQCPKTENVTDLSKFYKISHHINRDVQ